MQQAQPTLAVDPNLSAEQTQAQQTQVSALQTEAQGDTAALMSRYGTQLALAGGGFTSSGTTSAPIARAA